jgi:ATP-binding cassette subfamily B protein
MKPNTQYTTEQKVNNPGFGMHSARFSNKVKPKDIKGTLKRLFKYFEGQKISLILVVISVIISTISLLVGPRLIGQILDNISLGDDYFILIIFLLTSYFLVALFSWLSEFLIAKSSQKIIMSIRQDLFSKLGRLRLNFFDTSSHGDIMSRFTSDIDNVSTVISQSTTTLIQSSLTVLGSLIIMIFMDFRLAFTVLLSVPLIYGLSNTISKKTMELFKSQQKYMGAVNGLVEETVYGLTVIQGYNQENHIVKKFNNTNEELFNYGRKAQIWTGLLMPVMNVINNLTFTLVGIVGGLLVFNGFITVGIVASFIAYSRQFVRPLNEIASIYNTLMSAIAGSQRVFEILDKSEEAFNSEGIITNRLSGDLEFKNVEFSYNENKTILHDINFKIERGKRVAIIGPTGAGKTTIINLLSRFYEINKGKIMVDSQNIQDFNLDFLRSQLGIVLQDTYLFRGTILENIRYGNLSASDDEIFEAAKISKAHDFIMKLPHKYNTRLSFGGSNLSQGERQLITISRAVLTNPSILILDEATSSVDIMTEKLITKTMRQMMENRTSFVIAHRLSTIRDSDLIIAIDDGRIIEMGTHDELVETKGYYFKMLELSKINE